MSVSYTHLDVYKRQVLLDDKEGFMVPFEFASILLLVAMIGAVLLSKKEKPTK